MATPNSTPSSSLGDRVRPLKQSDLYHMSGDQKATLISRLFNLDFNDQRIDFIIGAATPVHFDEELKDLGHVVEEDVGAVAISDEYIRMTPAELRNEVTIDNLTLPEQLVDMQQDIREYFFARKICTKAWNILRTARPSQHQGNYPPPAQLLPSQTGSHFRFSALRTHPLPPIDGLPQAGPLPSLVLPAELSDACLEHALHDASNKGMPREIYLFPQHYPENVPPHWVSKKSREPGLLMASKAVRLEASRVYYGSQKFVVALSPAAIVERYDAEHALDFLHPIAGWVKDLVIFCRFPYVEQYAHADGTSTTHGGVGIVKVMLEKGTYRVKAFVESAEDPATSDALECCNRSGLAEIKRAWETIAGLLEWAKRCAGEEIEIEGEVEVVFVGCGMQDPNDIFQDLQDLYNGV